MKSCWSVGRSPGARSRVLLRYEVSAITNSPVPIPTWVDRPFPPGEHRLAVQPLHPRVDGDRGRRGHLAEPDRRPGVVDDQRTPPTGPGRRGEEDQPAGRRSGVPHVDDGYGQVRPGVEGAERGSRCGRFGGRGAAGAAQREAAAAEGSCRDQATAAREKPAPGYPRKCFLGHRNTPCRPRLTGNWARSCPLAEDRPTGRQRLAQRAPKWLSVTAVPPTESCALRERLRRPSATPCGPATPSRRARSARRSPRSTTPRRCRSSRTGCSLNPLGTTGVGATEAIRRESSDRRGTADRPRRGRRPARGGRPVRTPRPGRRRRADALRRRPAVRDRRRELNPVEWDPAQHAARSAVDRRRAVGR